MAQQTPRVVKRVQLRPRRSHGLAAAPLVGTEARLGPREPAVIAVVEDARRELWRTAFGVAGIAGAVWFLIP